METIPFANRKWAFAVIMGECAYGIDSFIVRVIMFHIPRIPHGAKLPWVNRKILDFTLELMLLAPVLESLVLIAIIEVAQKLKLTARMQIILSTAVLCATHADQWLPQVVVVAPLFVICAWSYLKLKETSRKDAFITIVLIHFVNNINPWLDFLLRELHRH